MSNKFNAWYLQFKGSEFGPLSIEEVRVILKSGKLNGDVYGWKGGFGEWQLIDHIPELREIGEEIKSAARGKGSKESDRRKSRRIPLIATVEFFIEGTQGGERAIGVCRDISVGGMQILSNQKPDLSSATVKLHITQVGVSDALELLVDAVVKRYLKDPIGFSVEFVGLSEAHRLALVQLVDNPQLVPAGGEKK